MNKPTQSWTEQWVQHRADVEVLAAEPLPPPKTVVLYLRERQAQALERFLASGGKWDFPVPPEADGVLTSSGHFLNSIQEPLLRALLSAGIPRLP